MRTIILPAVVVAIGILAALPFRRSASTSPNAELLSQHDVGTSSDQNTITSRSGVPASVVPLSMEQSSSSGDPDNLLADLIPLAAEARQQSTVSIESLPASYDEIAVPLADRDATKNLLNSARKSATPLTRNPSADAAAGSRWAFDRFGIPRPIEELRAQSAIESRTVGSASYSSARSASALDDPGLSGTSQWTQPQPLLAKESTTEPSGMVLASRQKSSQPLQQEPQLPATSQPSTDPSTLANSNSQPTDSAMGADQASGVAANYPVFQPVGTRVMLKQEAGAAESAGEPGKSSEARRDGQNAKRENRNRHWIYEPKASN